MSSSKAHLWQREHPDADVPVALSQHPELVDVSWHNDAMPSFVRRCDDADDADDSDNMNRPRLWVNYADVTLRECGGPEEDRGAVKGPWKRYAVGTGGDEAVIGTDDLDEALRALFALPVHRPAAPARGFIITRKSLDIAPSGQDVYYTEIVRLTATSASARADARQTHTCRIDIRSNAYLEQSHAWIERWDGTQWHQIFALRCGSMLTPAGLYVKKGTTGSTDFAPFFVADRYTLLCRACAVLKVVA